MVQNLDDIADLAEAIANRFLSKGRVNLKKIADSENIGFIKGNYGSHFIGELVHYLERFYIILNDDQLKNSESGRKRFTIAHELGHYFIDEHREKLKKGISLAFKENLNKSEIKKVEIAANHFAANLLMPKNHFIKHAKKLDIGLPGIFNLKTKYDTSIESTVHHYVNVNLVSCIMIKWRQDYSLQYTHCSNLFKELIKAPKYPPPVRFDSNYIKSQVEIIGTSSNDYIESAAPISRWISTILPRSANDILGIEQSVKLGDYGGITLVIL